MRNFILKTLSFFLPFSASFAVENVGVDQLQVIAFANGYGIYKAIDFAAKSEIPFIKILDISFSSDEGSFKVSFSDDYTDGKLFTVEDEFGYITFRGFEDKPVESELFIDVFAYENLANDLIEDLIDAGVIEESLADNYYQDEIVDELDDEIEIEEFDEEEITVTLDTDNSEEESVQLDKEEAVETLDDNVFELIISDKLYYQDGNVIEEDITFDIIINSLPE